MSALLRFSVIAALAFGIASSSFSQQVTTVISWPYHPNRPGVEAYMQGGAFVANTGSVTAMLFNPAGLAQMPGRLTAAVETGWASDTEYLDFFNVDFAVGFQPVQFAGVALQPKKRFSIGVFYTQPTDYDIKFEPIPIRTVAHPEGTGEFLEAGMERKQISLGLALATSWGEHFHLGGAVEWRRSNVRDRILSSIAEGHADGARFSIGTILRDNDFCLGISAQTKYKTNGNVIEGSTPIIQIDDPMRDIDRINIDPEPFPFTVEEPAAIRLGVATPYAFGRLRFSADAEYKDFESTVPIERWQFYGGGSVKLTSNFNLSFGAFTFRKDYSAYIEGPDSEIFLTAGGSVELSQFRFSASFMDSDLLTKDFVGQQFFNFAIGFVIP